MGGPVSSTWEESQNPSGMGLLHLSPSTGFGRSASVRPAALPETGMAGAPIRQTTSVSPRTRTSIRTSALIIERNSTPAPCASVLPTPGQAGGRLDPLGRFSRRAGARTARRWIANYRLASCSPMLAPAPCTRFSRSPSSILSTGIPGPPRKLPAGTTPSVRLVAQPSSFPQSYRCWLSHLRGCVRSMVWCADRAALSETSARRILHLTPVPLDRHADTAGPAPRPSRTSVSQSSVAGAQRDVLNGPALLLNFHHFAIALDLAGSGDVERRPVPPAECLRTDATGDSSVRSMALIRRCRSVMAVRLGAAMIAPSGPVVHYSIPPRTTEIQR